VISFTEKERSLLYTFVRELYENWNYRSVEGELLKSLVNKLTSAEVDLTEQENSRLQYLIREKKELYSYISNPAIWYRLVGEAGRQSGVGGANSTPGVGVSGGGRTSDFNGGTTYDTCLSVLHKLEE
jgi:hypothetical protein